jgi:uracil-DNA glycosylase family 4
MTSDADREEFLALVRGFAAHFEAARDSGAVAFGRRDVPVASSEASRVTPSHDASARSDPGPAQATVEASDVAPSDPPPTRQILPSAPPPTLDARSAPSAVPRPAGAAYEEDESTAIPSLGAPSGPLASGAYDGMTPVIARPPAVARTVVDGTPTNSKYSLPVLLEGEARVRACTGCKLCHGRRQPVYARGNPHATVMFVGEAPGADEDAQGLPFVGVSGALLDRIIAAMGLSPEEIYIANVIKCRPPNNRPPEADEIAACGGYLLEQIEAVRPRVLVTLGRTPSGFLLGSREPMSRMRGAWHAFRGIPLRATWHPAYLLRNPEAKRDTWADMRHVMARLGRAIAARPSESEEPTS